MVPVGLAWCCSQSLARRQLWQRSHSPCSSALAASHCQQGAGSILTYWCRWERRDLVPPLLVPQASGSPVFLLFSGEAAQLVITMRLEVGSTARPGAPLCCLRLQQVQHSLLHLFLMSLQWEKLSPLGKQQKENTQGRLNCPGSPCLGPEPSARSLPL